MDDYMETYETENELQDGYQDEYQEGSEWMPDPEETVQEDDTENSELLDKIIEALTRTQDHGTIGDYYFQALGCYVFPNFEVYEYFIDIDAVGHEWTETSDGHYIQLLYLEKYEEYMAAPEEPEETEELEEPEGILQDETELQTLETLESIRGMLSVIKENNTAFYEASLENQTEMLETVQETLAAVEETAAKTEGILYAGIVTSMLVGILAGSFTSHVFFGRMRSG